VALPWKCVQQSSNNLNIESTIDYVPSLSKNVMSMVLILDSCKFLFLGLDDDFKDHCML
jgi:hypothetical protein